MSSIYFPLLLISGAVWESIIRTAGTSRDSKTQVSLSWSCRNIWTINGYFETSLTLNKLSILLAIRFRLLKHTRLNVVAFLNELPKTQHDIASFTVDVNTYTVSPCLLFKTCPLQFLIIFSHFPLFSLDRTHSCHSQWVESSKKVSYFIFIFFMWKTSSMLPLLFPNLCCILSVAVDGKSRESTMAFSRVLITVPAGNTG